MRAQFLRRLLQLLHALPLKSLEIGARRPSGIGLFR